MSEEYVVTDIEIPPPARFAALCGPVVMVDELQSYGVATKGMAARIFGPGTMSSHLTVAGDIEALHAVAARLKIRRFFQAPKKPTDLPHYDLVPANREKALALGAIFVPGRTQARVRRLLRGFNGLAGVASSLPRAPAAPYQLLGRADLDANEWAACGQTAVAGLLRLPLPAVKGAFPGHRWCNLTQMGEALDALGVRWTRGALGSWPPARGMVQIQFEGPWTDPGASVNEALKRSHWVACAPVVDAPTPLAMICDVNAVDMDINGGWTRDPYCTSCAP